jgi:hypothetical protein
VFAQRLHGGYRPGFALERDARGVARQAIEVRAELAGEAFEFVQLACRIENVGIQFQRGVRGVETGTTAGAVPYSPDGRFPPARAAGERALRWKISRITMVRSITGQPTSFSRWRACEGEISWSTNTASTGSGVLAAGMYSAALSDSPLTKRRISSRLPTPRYAVVSKPGRLFGFCLHAAGLL